MIEYRNVRKEYRTEHGSVIAVNDLSFRVEGGALCVLLGPSGCGKTTLLRMTNRLVEPTSGSIMIDGKDVLEEDPVMLRRRIGYVIQGVGLFPHRTVAENIATTPQLVGMQAKQTAEQVDRLLEMMNLDPARYRDRYPAALSGGEAQRIGVARALAADPPLLLMDEPFGAIDPINRAEIRREFRELHRRLGKTVIFVSHDIHEALFLADRIALMHEGRLVQYGTPAELVASPASDFAARFFGDDRALLLLDTLRAADAIDGSITVTDSTTSISSTAPLRQALLELLASGKESLVVIDDDARKMGRISMESIREVMKEPAHAAERH